MPEPIAAITDADLERLDALEKEAHPANWRRDYRDIYCNNLYVVGDRDAEVEDLELIVALRNAWPALRARIAEMEKLLEQKDAATVRLVNVAHKHGWNGVENSKILETFFDDTIAQQAQRIKEQDGTLTGLRQYLEDFRVKWEGVITEQAQRIAELEAELKRYVEFAKEVKP